VQIELAECTIRSWRLEDAPSLAMNANNRNVWLTLRDRMPHPYTLRDAEAYVQQRLVEPHRLMFCIDVDGDAVGGIGVHPGDDVNRLTAELGYWLAEPYWGRGIMTAAVAAIVGYAFENRPLERIEAYVYANNPASARVLEKCGFTFEGRMRRNVIKDGAMLDSLLYALLRGEQRTGDS
jgi:RimJ/RimL family protein N-acetyltransferase